MNEPDRAHPQKTVVFFENIEQTREAAIALEKCGTDSMHVELSHNDLSVGGNREDADRRTTKLVSRGAIQGFVLGAILGAAIELALSFLFAFDGAGRIGAVAGMGLFGLWLGGFYRVVTGLPVNEQAFDALGGEPRGRDWILISGPDGVQTQATAILGKHGPTKVILAGRS